MLWKGADGSSLNHGCSEKKTDLYIRLMKCFQTLQKCIWLEAKQEDAINVFYCNKLTIAKCLFSGHNGNYSIE